jgi:hypothetical protein
MTTRIIAVVLALLAVAGLIAWYKLFRELPGEHFASDQEHFLYGSVGNEGTDGVPYWIWLTLPRVFPDLLPGPGGYASLGVLSQEGHEMPIGYTKRTIGIDRVGINCGLCHTSTYRLKPGDRAVIVPTAPAHQLDPQGYLRFLFACARDSRFTGPTIMHEIDKNVKLSWLDHQIYKYLLIPFTRRSLLKQQRVHNNYGWMADNPPWGTGRIDPFNPMKYRNLKQPVDGSIGNSDMPPLWNQKQHQGYSYHWDGLNTNLDEVVISSAIGDGAPKKWVEADWKKPDNKSSLKRIRKFISEAQAPKFPYPVDVALAAKGKALYDRECASCHAIGGAKTGKVEPVSNADLRTDRHRIDMWTANSAKAYNEYTSGYGWKLTHFVKEEGYVNVPLEGIWLRGPYLHNGSVPTLADLLEAPENRPRTFRRGSDVVDPVKVGFVTQGSFFVDTSIPGNGNGGHLWGTRLGADEKRAIIEHMKML